MDHCPHCGGVIDRKPGKPRSVAQHRRYFAMIAAAYDHWPENHGFRPESVEHLRKWLQVAAGYRTVHTIALDDVATGDAVAIIEATLKAAGVYSFVHAYGRSVAIVTSRSIAFERLAHKDACVLFDAVAQVIEAELCVPAALLIKEAESAA